MKTCSFLKRGSSAIACLFLFLPCLLTAQPDYSFKSATLQSGTALQTGAVYRFSNVKTGVDALVTITFISAGCTLSQFDNDGGAGYLDAFQPEILAPAHTNGYAEFHIAFVTAGTSTAMVQSEIPASAIDIDGNNSLWGGPLNEYDGISMGASAYVDYNMMGAQLGITYSAGWVQALNTGGSEYGGISLSATPVMITTVNAGVAEFDYRTGVNNQSNISTLYRQKSLYFKKFTYPNSVLALPAVASSNAIQPDNQPGGVPELFPSLIHSNVTLCLTASTNSHVMLRLLNNDGREVMYKRWTANKGKNRFDFIIDKYLPAGVYIAMIYNNGKVNSERIIIQP
jgi:hypothetical protein